MANHSMIKSDLGGPGPHHSVAVRVRRRGHLFLLLWRPLDDLLVVTRLLARNLVRDILRSLPARVLTATAAGSATSTSTRALLSAGDRHLFIRGRFRVVGRHGGTIFCDSGCRRVLFTLAR